MTRDSMFARSGIARDGDGAASVQGFDDLVRMLKTAATDKETVDLAESMGRIASLVEQIAPQMAIHAGGTGIGPLLVDLMAALRQHRQLVTQLGLTWRELPEHANYVVALNNFRLLLNQWLMERAVNKFNVVQFAEFEALAWRTLGDGMLLMDIHQQLSARSFSETSEAELEPVRAEKANNWWSKLRGDN